MLFRSKSSDSNHTSAWFDDEGHQYQVDQEIPFNQLPAAEKDGFETIYNLYYAGWEIDDEAHVVDRLNMGLIYVIEIEKGKVERELSFSPIGILLKDVIDDDSDDILPVIVPDQIRELIESLFPHNPDVEILEIEDEDDGMLEVDVCDGGLHRSEERRVGKEC